MFSFSTKPRKQKKLYFNDRNAGKCIGNGYTAVKLATSYLPAREGGMKPMMSYTIKESDMTTSTSVDEGRRTVTSQPTEQRKEKASSPPMGLLYFLIALCLSIAWFSPLQHAFAKRMWPPAPTGPRDSHEFTALAYTDGEASAIDSLDEHLDALSANGYSPVALSDALGLINQGTPVPRKAVLLTIDSHSKVTAAQAKRILRNHGWNGVLFVDTQAIADRQDGAMNWQHLKALAASGTWEISSMGHAGRQKVATAPDQAEGHYLTSLKWHDDSKKHETLSELQARVVQDHTMARDLVEEHLGQLPMAYAYPFGDFGQHRHPDDYAGRVNLAATASFYDLAFTYGNVGMNTMFSDPSRLNRMRVQPDWTPADLIQAISVAAKSVETVEDTDLSRRTPGWIADWGNLSHVEEGLRVAASPMTRGGRAWLAGSDLRKDLSATVTFRIEDGDAAIYLRAAPDDSAYVLLQLTPKGETTVRQKVSWEAPILAML